MPRYRVTLSDGRVVTLEAATQPSEAEILAEIARGGGEVSPPDPLEPSVMEGLGTKVARYSRALPAIGGAVGGLLGWGVGNIPGAVGGAAAGGAAGDALSMGIRKALGKGAPESLGAAGTELLEQSALQVPMELGGRALAGAAKLGGRTLYDAALRPTGTLLQEFPDVVKTAIKNRLPVGDVLPGVGRKGSQIANQARQASGRQTAQLLGDAGKAGTRFSIRDVIETPIQALAKRIDDQPEVRADMAALGKFVRELLEDKAGAITPERLKAIKASAQAVSKPIYKAKARGEVVAADRSLAAQANEAVASGARTALETIPGVAESEAQTKALIGAAKAIRQAESRRAPLTTHILSGVAGSAGIGGGVSRGGDTSDNAALGLTAYILMRAMASPRSMSRMGIELNRDSIQQVLRLLPYAAEGMYSATRETAPQTGPEAR